MSPRRGLGSSLSRWTFKDGPRYSETRVGNLWQSDISRFQAKEILYIFVLWEHQKETPNQSVFSVVGSFFVHEHRVCCHLHDLRLAIIGERWNYDVLRLRQF